MKRWTTEQYSNWIEENRPDYRVIGEYINDSTKILHEHIKSKKRWMCSPSKFKKGIGHPEVTRKTPIKISNEEYLKWIEENRPDYQLLERYKNTKTKILHKHIPTGIKWYCSPEKFKKGHKPTFLTKCPRLSSNDYDDYLKCNTKFIRIGEYKRQSTPIDHMFTKSKKVYNFSPKVLLNNPDFDPTDKIFDKQSYCEWLANNRPEYKLIDDYKNMQTKAWHIHIPTQNKWFVKPNNVQQGQNAPFLKQSSVSNVSLKWLELIAQEHDCYIQHAGNGGEITLPDIGKVDGYCKETNTVYEFHGDFWHGNPTIYESADINPVNNKTFGELFDSTVTRDELIISKGYKLFVVWRSSFLDNKLGSYFN